jgi:hypothetical protein
MRKLLLLSLALASQQALACIPVATSMICSGDTVYKGSSYSQGATVIAENQYAQQVTVRSKSTGSLFVENVSDLDIANGCLGQLCVGTKVLKGSSYSQGATIIAINYYAQTLTVRSISTSSMFVERGEDLDVTNGCIENLCIGERVYKGNSYSQGATVIGINYYKRTVNVRSNSTSSLFSENLSDVDLTKGCVGTVCVNDKVYKGSEYSQGASVLAVNAANYTATIRSISTGSLFSESIYNLQGGTNQPQWPQQPPLPPRPQEPQWPQNPPLPPRPQEPNHPPRPRPEPRPPVREECTVNRLDPSGLYITSYVATAYSRAEACSIATKDCSRDLKGRQSCNIAR